MGEIHELFVVPEMRGRGVGNALLQRGLAYFCEKNLHIAELWVGISNHAQKFYEKAGFKGAEIVGKWLRMWKCITGYNFYINKYCKTIREDRSRGGHY